MPRLSRESPRIQVLTNRAGHGRTCFQRLPEGRLAAQANRGVLMTRIKSMRPSPGTVIASLALFVALGGTSYAITATGSKATSNVARTLKVHKFIPAGSDR